MGWSIGFDEKWGRDIGYGVPAYCDHPDCTKQIDRGLAYVCGGQPFGGDDGCGLYFCEDHLAYYPRKKDTFSPQLCERCGTNAEDLFKPKPDHPEWMQHKLVDVSWGQWRADHRESVRLMTEALKAHGVNTIRRRGASE